jgi:hypothetical protein
MVQLHEFQLRQMLSSPANLGAKNALREMGVDKMQISKAEANRRYSRRRIDRCVKEKKIIPIKSKGSVMFNSAELETISQTVELYSKHLQSTDKNK